MALSPDEKRKSMDAAIARERAGFKRRLRSTAAVQVGGGLSEAVKEQAKGITAGLKTISTVGWPTAVVGAAIYAAHIRQMDRERHQAHGRLPQRNGKTNGVERDYA
jgi:hypothetical protein